MSELDRASSSSCFSDEDSVLLSEPSGGAYAVVGLIAAGKSTAIKALMSRYPNDYVMSPEPTYAVNKLLGKFYAANNEKEPEQEDKRRQLAARRSQLTLSVQVSFLTARLSEQYACLEEQRRSGRKIIMDRDAYTDPEIFPKLALEKGRMSQEDYDCYKQVWDHSVRPHKWMRPNGIIYLRVSPETAMAQCKKRNSSEEEGLPLSYMQELYDMHENMIKKFVAEGEIPVHVIDADAGNKKMTVEEVAEAMREIVQ